MSAKMSPAIVLAATLGVVASLSAWPTVAAADDTASATEQGEKIFKTTCSLCHATGAAGAPMVGVKTDWTDRIAKGKETLYQHAIAGFQGKNGMMPAKGGNPSLADAGVKAAVDYMVSKVK